MKKTLKIALLVAVVALSLFTLTGCGKEEKKEEPKKPDLSAYAGTYEGKYTKFVGDPDTVKDERDKFSLELKADGTGIHKRNTLELNIEWEYDGETFKMVDKMGRASIEYTGTLKDGKLDIFNGDPENALTCEYVYEKK